MVSDRQCERTNLEEPCVNKKGDCNLTYLALNGDKFWSFPSGYWFVNSQFRNSAVYVEIKIHLQPSAGLSLEESFPLAYQRG